MHRILTGAGVDARPEMPQLRSTDFREPGAMRVLTVIANPNPRSFCHAILQRFHAGLQVAGHDSEVVDLYAIGFDPVFRVGDFASYVHESMPLDVLERMDLRAQARSAVGGPLRRAAVSLLLRGKTPREIAKLIHDHRPADARSQWEKVKRAQGLVFIAPVIWLGFPAILKGWFERVFAYGDAYALTAEGWAGEVRGRIPLLRHEEALVISTTLFREEDYKAALAAPMEKIIDDWGLRYPGVKHVEHVYFYGVTIADEPTRRTYLERAYRLGCDFGARAAHATAMSGGEKAGRA
jgi:NAD(P)H dehydrogenase (quinone)